MLRRLRVTFVFGTAISIFLLGNLFSRHDAFQFIACTAAFVQVRSTLRAESATVFLAKRLVRKLKADALLDEQGEVEKAVFQQRHIRVIFEAEFRRRVRVRVLKTSGSLAVTGVGQALVSREKTTKLRLYWERDVPRATAAEQVHLAAQSAFENVAVLKAGQIEIKAECAIRLTWGFRFIAGGTSGNCPSILLRAVMRHAIYNGKVFRFF